VCSKLASAAPKRDHALAEIPRRWRVHTHCVPLGYEPGGIGSVHISSDSAVPRRREAPPTASGCGGAHAHPCPRRNSAHGFPASRPPPPLGHARSVARGGPEVREAGRRQIEVASVDRVPRDRARPLRLSEGESRWRRRHKQRRGQVVDWIHIGVLIRVAATEGGLGRGIPVRLAGGAPASAPSWHKKSVTVGLVPDFPTEARMRTEVLHVNLEPAPGSRAVLPESAVALE